MENKNIRPLKNILLFFIVLCLMVISFGSGIYLSGKNALLEDFAKEEAVYIGKVTGKYSVAEEGRLSQDIDFKLFWEVWDSLMENYVDSEELTDKKLFYGALKGMAAAAGDPYTVFMNPKVAKEFADDLAGTFEGIGAEIGIKEDVLTIIAPLPDMPAEKAGLRSGDKVLAIDGESTAGISVDEAVNKIRGPKDSTVVLSVSRSGEDGLKEVSIERGVITVKSVQTTLREDNIFVIEMSNFNNDTETLFNEAVREAIEKNPKGIILDMRNNPGGYLDTAIEVSSEWVSGKKLVVMEKYTETETPHLSRGRARLEGFPTVILVNQGSASASEIVSGTLQDYGQAVVVGKKTFGKGSVQNLLPFGDGSSVKITVAKWMTPNGRSINDEGIAPDIEVDLTAEDFNQNKDPQMEKAVEVINEGVENFITEGETDNTEE